MKLGFKTGFGSTAALGRSVGTIGRTSGRGRVGTVGRIHGRPAWSERIDLADEISRPDAGRSSRLGRSVRPVRDELRGREALLPGSRALVVRGCGVADRGQFPGS
ncbi:unnamed protein product [Microthlaspi erraticum]|uniref:Uncharacterized protein n=1 Tax=Microthlaspi erraticum TaxID=1685480 RepID=A0A6D2I960_9BRAS|nr:unnamed protein product [Microthlaspi erraticum]